MLEPRFRSLEAYNDALEREAAELKAQFRAFQERNRRLRSVLAALEPDEEDVDEAELQSAGARHLATDMSMFATWKSVDKVEAQFANITTAIQNHINETAAEVTILSTEVTVLSDDIDRVLSLSVCDFLPSYGGHLYQYVPVLAPYGAAKVLAQDMPKCCNQTAHLVTIGNATENTFVQSLMLSFGWLGLTDQVTEGQFKWVTGEPLSYTNWAGGEPNNLLNEDCVQMQLLSGKWQDVSCLVGLAPFVVEYDCS